LSASAPKKPTRTTGLRYWMTRVLVECDRVSADFSADPVHDLRVALRRCRSMADGLLTLDPDPAWKAMKKAGRTLFRSLGDLRDVQIMMEWIDKLYPADARVERSSVEQARVDADDSPALPLSEQNSESIENVAPTEDRNQNARDPAANALLNILGHREGEHKRQAQAALEEFDRKQWRHWSKSLPHRAARFRLGSPLFKHLALERWTEARALHERALRNRSHIAFHTLRIGIKRFRYIVENFLPEEHQAWSHDLKGIQDLLGEVHDLDVLWNTAVSCRVFADEGARKRWRAKILEERARRIERYREETVGRDSLWQTWRAGLPQGQQIQSLATRRMKLWAKALDPDFAHSEHVAKLALELYDGLGRAGLLSSNDRPNERFSLWLAALLHDVGKSKGKKGHHKASHRLIEDHGAPLGWKPEVLRRAAVVARFHCGALPKRTHKSLRDLLPGEQKTVIRLAAVLRLANALDTAHDRQIRRVQIEGAERTTRDARQRTNGFLRKPVSLGQNEGLVIAAEGYLAATPTAQTIAAERHLLETVLRRPVVVRAMKSIRVQAGSNRPTSRRVRHSRP
jgi:CHAD domain-containing protein